MHFSFPLLHLGKKSLQKVWCFLSVVPPNMTFSTELLQIRHAGLAFGDGGKINKFLPVRLKLTELIVYVMFQN